MRTTHAAILLLTTGLFLADDSHAQQPDRLGDAADSLQAGPVLPGAASSRVSDSAYAAALDAPRILVFPDTSVNAHIVQLTSPKNIDPEMIRLNRRERNGAGESKGRPLPRGYPFLECRREGLGLLAVVILHADAGGIAEGEGVVAEAHTALRVGSAAGVLDEHVEPAYARLA